MQDAKVFKEWCNSHEIWLDNRAHIQSQPSSDSNSVRESGIFVAEFITSGSIVVKIPKTAILSVNTSSMGKLNLIPQADAAARLDTTGNRVDDSHLALAFALLAEWLEGSESDWWGYLQMMPWEDPPPLALFWDYSDEDGKTAMSIIRGTGLLRKLQDFGARVNTDIANYYTSFVKPVLSYKHRDHLLGSTGLALYRAAYSMVSSRAFIVDSWHGLAMVPVADAFNHHEDNGICLHTEHDVCPECGALFACMHDTPPASPTVPQWDKVPLGPDTADMVTCRDHEAFEEIFNSYSHSSPLSNMQLLLQYGFVEDGNSADRVIFEQSEVYAVTGSYPDQVGHEALAIDSDGEPSSRMWAICMAQSQAGHTQSEAAYSPLVPATSACDLLAAVCLRRLNLMHCSGNVPALVDLLDSNPSAHRKTRLAITYVLTEALILQACIGKHHS